MKSYSTPLLSTNLLMIPLGFLPAVGELGWIRQAANKSQYRNEYLAVALSRTTGLMIEEETQYTQVQAGWLVTVVSSKRPVPADDTLFWDSFQHLSNWQAVGVKPIENTALYMQHVGEPGDFSAHRIAYPLADVISDMAKDVWDFSEFERALNDFLHALQASIAVKGRDWKLDGVARQRTGHVFVSDADVAAYQDNEKHAVGTALRPEKTFFKNKMTRIKLVSLAKRGIYLKVINPMAISVNVNYFEGKESNMAKAAEETGAIDESAMGETDDLVNLSDIQPTPTQDVLEKYTQYADGLWDEAVGKVDTVEPTTVYVPAVPAPEDTPEKEQCKNAVSDAAKELICDEILDHAEKCLTVRKDRLAKKAAKKARTAELAAALTAWGELMAFETKDQTVAASLEMLTDVSPTVENYGTGSVGFIFNFHIE